MRVEHYFDEYRLYADPHVLASIADDMARALETTSVPIERVAGIATAGVPLATLLSQELSVPLAIVRPQARDHGTAKAVEGASVAGRQVLLVDGVLGTGAAALRALGVLRQHAATVDNLAIVLDRERGGPQALAARGVTVRPLASWSDVAARLEQAGS